ncbi:substrate-binding domain-containing protein [Chromobacterium phragmitis]|uniref:substrate-binding domain-containing protein n=1 Tax=Chromobacterium phragmitis TaxID=2202141 RepID=UPI003263F1BF
MRPSRFCLSLLIACCALAQAAPLPAVQVRGSQALLPWARRAAEDYMARYPGSSVTVVAGSSAFGAQSLLDGNADIALAHGAMPSSWQSRLARSGVKLAQIVAGYQALLPVVSPDNPISDIDPLRLRAVFTGAIVDWKELGAPPGPVTPLVGPPSGGQAWREAVLGPLGRFAPHSALIGGDWAAQLSRRPGGIAIVTAAELAPGLKPLTLSGLRADPALVACGRYPLRIPLLLLTPQPPTPAGASFLRYLQSRLRAGDRP